MYLAEKPRQKPAGFLAWLSVFSNPISWARMLLIPTKVHPHNRRQGICSEPLSNLMCFHS
jgi:hypothetical protein